MPSETKDLQQGLQEMKPFFCHRCHNSAQLIYCFLSPSLQFQSYRGPVVVRVLWLGDLNQDQFLSSASKGRRSGFIGNSMWAFWAKPVLWVPLPLLAGRMRCAAVAGTLSWALQSQTRSGHRLGLQGEWRGRGNQTRNGSNILPFSGKETFLHVGSWKSPETASFYFNLSLE